MSNKKWMGKPILSPKDHDDLELKAAVAQYGLGLSKEDAEKHAYKEYLINKSKTAAAHHLKSIKEANQNGDLESAKKHGVMYNLHAQKAGFDPVAEPPEDVKAEISRPKSFKFKAHPADIFVANEQNLTKNDPLNPTDMLGYVAGKKNTEPPRTDWARGTKMFIGGGNEQKLKTKGTKPKLPKVKPNKLENELMGSPELANANPEPSPNIGDGDVATGAQHMARLKNDLGIPSSPTLGVNKPTTSPPKANPNKVAKLVADAFKDEPPTMQQMAQKMTQKSPKLPRVKSGSLKLPTANTKEPKGGIAAIKELKLPGVK